MLSYFLQILLEKGQYFASVNEVYEVVTQSRYCLKSKKRKGRSEYIEIGNS